MPPRAEHSIACVNFRVCCQDVGVLGPSDPSYRSFCGTTCREAEALRLDIRLVLGSPPDTSQLPRVYDGGESWSLLMDEGSYYVRAHPPLQGGDPAWTVRVTCDFRQATVYCSQRLVMATDTGVALMSPIRYPLDQILLMYVLSLHEGMVVHAAGAKVNGKGFLFAGKSGAGKSTLCRHLAQREGLKLLSDDRIALRKIRGSFMAYGTPWAGEQGVALNESAPLCGIYFLRHSEADQIVPLTPGQAVARLLPVTSIPWYDREAMERVLLFCDDLLAHVPTFELHFKPGAHVAKLLETLA